MSTAKSPWNEFSNPWALIYKVYWCFAIQALENSSELGDTRTRWIRTHRTNQLVKQQLVEVRTRQTTNWLNLLGEFTTGSFVRRVRSFVWWVRSSTSSFIRRVLIASQNWVFFRLPIVLVHPGFQADCRINSKTWQWNVLNLNQVYSDSKFFCYLKVLQIGVYLDLRPSAEELLHHPAIQF